MNTCEKAFPVFLICLLITIYVLGQTAPASNSLPFHVVAVTTSGQEIWAAGTDQGIAVSNDNGGSWQAKHSSTAGGTLLTIEFNGPKFGYAAGTSGLMLTTSDGGETWAAHNTNIGSVIRISLADKDHGILISPGALLFSIDGATWSAVPVDTATADAKKYKYPFAVAALNATHMAAMLKEGPAQYYSHVFVATEDGGKTWKSASIPHANIYSFLRVGDKYWAVGNEVVHREVHGGYAEAATWSSTDGIAWVKGSNDVSACQLHGCSACTTTGCLASSALLIRPFESKTTLGRFGTSASSPTWTANDRSICFVGMSLECVALTGTNSSDTKADSKAPELPVPPPFGVVAAAQGPTCIQCSVSPMMVDPKVSGAFTLPLTITISTSGLVLATEVSNAPNDAIRQKIESQVRNWLFEPYYKDGTPVQVRLKTNVRINVIRNN